MSYSKYEIKSVIVSIIIALGVTTVFIHNVVIPLTTRTPEEQAFCMQPNVICEPTTPFFMIATLIVGMSLYVLLVWFFDRVWARYHPVGGNNEVME